MFSSKIWDVLKLTSINDLVIDSNASFDGIEQLRVSKLSILGLRFDSLQLQRFIDINSNNLISLNTESVVIRIGRLPKLTTLSINIAQLNELEMSNLPNLDHIHILHNGFDHNIRSIYTKLLNSSVTSIFIDAHYAFLQPMLLLVSELAMLDKSHITHVSIIAGIMVPNYANLIAGIKTLKVKIFNAYGSGLIYKN